METKGNAMESGDMGNVQTGKELSPILQKKRLPRKHLVKRSNNREEQQVDSKSCKSRNSGIPVCVKDHITSPQSLTKTILTSKLPSSDKNAKNSRQDKPHKIPGLLNINTPTMENTKPHKLLPPHNIKSHSKQLDLEHSAVGNESAERPVNNSPKVQSTITSLGHMDMLYRNNKFDKTAVSASTTFDSIESGDLHELREFLNASVEYKMFRTPECTSPHDCIIEEEAPKDCGSQLNYDSVDEHLGTYVISESITENIHNEVGMTNLSLQMQTDQWKHQQFINDPFRGFDNVEIKEIEDNLTSRREFYKSLKPYKMNKKDYSSLNFVTNEVNNSTNGQSHNKIVISSVNGDNSEDISITPNNRVKISIDNNCIKIKIKSPLDGQIKFQDQSPNDLVAIANTEQANDIVSEILEKVYGIVSHKEPNDIIQNGNGSISASPYEEPSYEEPVPLRKSENHCSELVKENLTTSNQEPICMGGFKSAGGNNIKINNKFLKKATFMYENLNIESHASKEKNFAQAGSSTNTEGKLYTPLSEGGSHSQRGSGFRHGHPRISHDKQCNVRSRVITAKPHTTEAESIVIDPPSKCGFSSASGKAIKIDIDKLNMFASKFEEFGDPTTSNFFQEHREVIPNPFKKPERTSPELMGDMVGMPLSYHNPPGNSKSSNLNASTPIRTAPKKRLGVSRIKCTDIPKEKLERARLLFEDCDKSLPYVPGNKDKSSNIDMCLKSPTRSFSEDSLVLASTPNEGYGYHKVNTKSMPKKQSLLIERKTSPPKGIISTYDKDSIFVFHEKSCSNFEVLQNDIDIEYMNLKRKLDILTERKQAIEQQRHLIEGSVQESKRAKPGVLMRKKMSAACRVHLFELNYTSNQHFSYFNVDDKVFEITPKNAEKMHFNSNNIEYRATLKTLDGANVIPNTKNTIGATEIGNALQAMDGVDPRLIPKGWVLNHYKWIVWKLASYERRLPQYFGHYLTVDNIMQQLKYRYDKEIDQAQRSSLKRILEKDDVPNKRMVLCVADIIQVYANNFELLLTDGWYAIRTIIDSILCQQILKKRITIGMKLIIQGAELINGEGCHPLEIPDHTKLKISFNGTRRAAWYVKLGFYKNAFPFPISLNTIDVNGGIVPCVKVFIIRAYPLRYMETHNGTKIWRNSRAEEKHATDFDMECMKELEKIKLNVIDEYERELYKKTNKKWTKQSISGISCPKTLYQIMEGANDPECVYNLLNSHQKSLVMDYKLNAASERQREIAEKISKQVNMVNRTKREVTPVRRLLVTDALKQNKTCVVVNVWRPSEDQLHMFKEGSCMTIYNLNMRKTNELNTTFRTLYKIHDNCTFKSYERQILPIAMTTDTYYKPMFNEFDTVGIIVDMQINTFDQELWLADIVGRLLFVKIVDGPKICSLLDNQNVGYVVALSNLMLQSPHPKFGQAIASQYTIITQYPEEKYLQNGLEIFNSQLKNTSKLIRECKHSIESLRSYVNLKNYSNRMDFTLNQQFEYSTRSEDLHDENTSIPSELTITDVAMSMIDTDQFL